MRSASCVKPTSFAQAMCVPSKTSRRCSTKAGATTRRCRSSAARERSPRKTLVPGMRSVSPKKRDKIRGPRSPHTASRSLRRPVCRSQKDPGRSLGNLGEHEQAILVLDDLLRLERTNEQAAANREILARALDEMWRDEFGEDRATGQDVGARPTRGAPPPMPSWPLSKARRRKREGGRSDGGPSAIAATVIRYGSGLAELWAYLAASGEIARLVLVLIDPERAAKKRDTMFRRDRGRGERPARTCELRNGDHADVFARGAGGAPHAGQRPLCAAARRCAPSAVEWRTTLLYDRARSRTRRDDAWAGGRIAPRNGGPLRARLLIGALGLLGAAGLGCRSSRAPAPAKSESSTRRRPKGSRSSKTTTSGPRSARSPSISRCSSMLGPPGATRASA